MTLRVSLQQKQTQISKLQLLLISLKLLSQTKTNEIGDNDTSELVS